MFHSRILGIAAAESYRHHRSTPLPDYFASDGATLPVIGASTPTGVYDAISNKTFLTYERWDGIQRIAQVETFDHTTGAWGTSYQAGDSILHDDDHGVPAINIGPNGHLFVFYGPHGDKMRIRSSVNPRDPSAWNVLSDLGLYLTYPHPIFVGSDLHFFARRTDSDRMPLVHYKASGVTGNTASFGAEEEILELGTNSRFYPGAMEIGPDGFIWLGFTRADFADSFRRDIYILRFDPATGNVHNIDSSVIVAPASYPVPYATADASFKVVATNPTGYSTTPHFCFDGVNDLHLFYADGPDTTSSSVYHKKYSGGAWSAATLVGTKGFWRNQGGIRPFGTGIEMLWSKSTDGTRGGDIYRATRAADGTFTAGVQLRARDPSYPLENPVSIKGAPDELGWVFAEINPNGTSLDSTAGDKRVFAWGSTSYKGRAWSDQLALSGTTVKAGLALGDLVALITSRAPTETLTLTDPSGQFAISGRTIVTAKALAPGSYPITISSSIRGNSGSASFTITVQTAVDVTDKALALWNFGEGSGQVVNDSSPHALNGYLGLTSGVDSSDVSFVSTGIENNTAGQDGLMIPYQPVMNACQGGMHIFAAVKLTNSLTGGHQIIARRDATINEAVFNFLANGGSLQFTAYTNGTSAVSTTLGSATIVLDTWALVECEVTNAGSVIIRQDGVAQVTQTISTGPVLNVEAPITIGAQKNGATFAGSWRGDIGCVHMYPRTLSSTEAAAARTAVQSLMAARGVTINTGASPPAGNLLMEDGASRLLLEDGASLLLLEG